MKPQFVRCEYCKMEIPQEQCELAAFRTIIDGKEYLFCCAKCAQQYQKKAKKPASKATRKRR